MSMDRIWEWAWGRHGRRYSWAVFMVTFAVTLPIFVLPVLLIGQLEGPSSVAMMATIGVVTAFAAVYALAMPGSAMWRHVERWAGGDRTCRLEALTSTYTIARTRIVRAVVVWSLAGGTMCGAASAVAGAEAWRTVQYGIVGITLFLAVPLSAVHTYVEGFVRPIRVSIAGDSGIGDPLPRSRPTFATWSQVSVLSIAWSFTLAGALLAAVTDRIDDDPAFAVLIAAGVTLVFGAPITVAATFAPALRPIRDLAEGTDRVAGGDYSQRLPVVQDDDLGALAAAFNRMQTGLAERERLQAAFGSYVDPVLATRLLGQGDDIFSGERLDVTVMFVDIRDFTPFAEVNAPEDTVARLNALFEIVIPAVLDAGGHVNKYLGDGALAVFGAPNPLAHHADAAVRAAVEISRVVAERFEGALRIGIGINTGPVIAGTIGGAGKLEFTLIGDTVNVASRVEQLTKTTGDTILLTEQTRDALAQRTADFIDRGTHHLRGKGGPVRVHTTEVGAGGVGPTHVAGPL